MVNPWLIHGSISWLRNSIHHRTASEYQKTLEAMDLINDMGRNMIGMTKLRSIKKQFLVYSQKMIDAERRK